MVKVNRLNYDLVKDSNNKDRGFLLSILISVELRCIRSHQGILLNEDFR